MVAYCPDPFVRRFPVELAKWKGKGTLCREGLQSPSGGGGSFPVSQYCIMPGNKEADQPGPPTQPAAAAEAAKGGVRDLGRECVSMSKAAQAGSCARKKGRLHVAK